MLTVRCSVCTGCGSDDSKSQCSGCNAPYCGRDCQVKHWPIHKAGCAVIVRTRNAELSRQAAIDRLFATVCKIIAGNVIILNAWYRGDSGYVNIEITESLQEFSQPGTHFLHMKYIDTAVVDVATVHTTTASKYADPGLCYVKFSLRDFTYETSITIRVSQKAVRAKHPQPGQEWSLMYEV